MIKQDKARRRPREQTQSKTEEQQTMDDKFIFSSSGTPKTGLRYLTESFALNSVERTVQRQGKGRRPETNLSAIARSQEASGTGRKLRVVDVFRLGEHFAVYVRLVNMVLERVYESDERADSVGRQLAEHRGKGYNFLKNLEYLRYRNNEEIKSICFERMYRNALEEAARVILSDWRRRQLIATSLSVLLRDENLVLRLLKNKYISSSLITTIRKECSAIKTNGKSYYYVVSVLKQLRRLLDEMILTEQGEPLRFRKSQRVRVKKLLEHNPSLIMPTVKAALTKWTTDGYPFSVPKMLSFSEDFSAGSESDIGQGYWYSVDRNPNRKNEVLFFLKLPEPLEGMEHTDSPYRTKTLGFRFLNWFPKAVQKDLQKADRAERNGQHQRAKQLRFRAAKFSDMHQQLMNTIEYHHLTYQLKLSEWKKSIDSEELELLEERKEELRGSRRCKPPQLVLRGHRAILYLPFLPPTYEVIETALGKRNYHRRAGADRGLRVPIAVSVQKDETYVDELIEIDDLLKKRILLLEDTKWLQSEIGRKQNNWENKHPNSNSTRPSHLLKKQRYHDAIWDRIRRIDREIARQVASRLVWFCEEHEVKTIVFENLKNYSAPSGYNNLSWSLSANLFSKVFETVRYMRRSLGHSYGGVWVVSPAWTSQTCHQCGEIGIRVSTEISTSEMKTGEFFYCEKCEEHFHADVNASRNIIHVQQKVSSAVPGRSA
jgi:transposase